jgi:4-amino-4-deoxy-L-arabinose transferase-like glycosyltransferase
MSTMLRTGAPTPTRTPTRPAAGSGRVWAALSLLVGLIGLAGAIWSLHEPQYWDAGGFYVPLAESIYRHGDLILGDGGLFHTPGHALVIVAGWLATGENTWVPHLVSLLPAVVVLFASFRFVRRHEGGSAGLAVVAVLVSIPVFQSQARIAHPEMLVAACTSLAVLACANERPRSAGGWLAAATVAKLTAIAAAPALALWCVWWCGRAPGELRSRRRMVRVAASVAVPACVVLLVWLAYHTYETHGALFKSQGLTRNANPNDTPITLVYFPRRTLGRVQQLLFQTALGPVVATALGGTAFAWHRLRASERFPLILLGVLPALSYVAMLTFVGLPLPRYIVPALGPLACSLVIMSVGWGSRRLAAGTALTVVLGLALMWRTSASVNHLDLAHPHNTLPLIVVLSGAAILLAAQKRRRPAITAGALAALFSFFMAWHGTRYLNPESNLTYRYLLARDQRVAAAVERATSRHPGVDVLTADLPFGGFPYSAYLGAPYLGWVGRPIQMRAEGTATGPFVLISTPEATRSFAVTEVIADSAPKGGPWAERERRTVSLVEPR